MADDLTEADRAARDLHKAAMRGQERDVQRSWREIRGSPNENVRLAISDFENEVLEAGLTFRASLREVYGPGVTVSWTYGWNAPPVDL